MPPSAHDAPPASAPAPASGKPAAAGVAVLLAIVVFAGLRFAALHNDLWMDEIWSVQAVQDIKSAGEIFTRYLQANNHPLSSLWLYAITPARAEWMYRMLSWATGVASVVLGVLIVRRQLGRARPDVSAAALRAAGLSAALLFGGCYFLIVYSSEARGYAPALGFSLLAYYALLRTPPHTFSLRWVLLYWVAFALALLSHTAVLQILAAAMLRSAVEAFETRMPWRKAVRLFFTWHGVPMAVTIAFVLFFVRRMAVGGAPEPAVRQTLGELVAYTFGLPTPEIGWFALPALAIAGAFALWRMRRRTPADAAFYAVVIFSAPVLALLAARLAVLFPRYFIFGSAWALLLLAYLFGMVWEQRPRLRIIAMGGIALFLIGNSVHIRTLLRHGRGEYRAALRYIGERTATPDISLCSDHDNRNYMLIAYYGGRVLPGRRLLYFPGNGSATGRPQWLLVHRLDGLPPPDPRLFDDRGNVYDFEKRFRHAPLAGWDWFVFRNTVVAQ